MVFFFFFKQKTAYEMRISDWSSDVCSSDLDPVHRRRLRIRAGDEVRVLVAGQGGAAFAGLYARAGTRQARRACRDGDRARLHPDRHALRPAAHRAGLRSEEHTSELQSLMRNSYAVFCLKKKNQQQTK